MQKEKEFQDCHFSAEVVVDVIARLTEMAKRIDVDLTNSQFRIDHGDSIWNHDTFEEFLADYRRYHELAFFNVWGGGFDVSFTRRSRSTFVTVKAPHRNDIEALFDVLERKVTDAKLAPLPQPPKSEPVVFIGHGRSAAWRDLKDHLQDKHGIQIEAYETGARAGHAIRDILEEMVAKSSFALLVLTGEDEQADGRLRARQNVIHEAGLFQGRLGFPRAILLIENGVEEFSNVQGIQYIPFGQNNIKETFGEVVATLRREFQYDG